MKREKLVTPVRRSSGKTQSEKIKTLRLWFESLRKLRGERWGHVIGYFFILPGVLLFAMFNIWPLWRGLEMAFTDYRFLAPESQPFVGLQHFREMFFKDIFFWRSLGHSLIFSIIYLPPMILLALFASSVIGRVKGKLSSGFMRVAVYLPVVLPIMVCMLLWKSLLATETGFINSFIRERLHLGFHPGWLTDKNLALPSVAIASIWKSFGFPCILFLIGIYNISNELYEAAVIDGAGPFKQWRYITLPLLKPILTLVFVLNAGIVGVTQEMMLVYGESFGPGEMGRTLGYYIWLTAFRYGDWRMGYAAAMSLVLGLVSIVLAGTIFKIMRTERT